MSVRIQISGDTWQVQGDLLFSTIESLLPRLPDLYAQGKPSIIDLSAVEHIDSAGLAWLVDSVRLCGPALRFRALPPLIHGIAEIYGVLPLLHSQE